MWCRRWNGSRSFVPPVNLPYFFEFLLSAGLDSYIDIRRGSLIIAVIGICINPLKIMNVGLLTLH
jgi:cytosine/uracil/thiamine/allantoin permease